jgi:hypothetical protein
MCGPSRCGTIIPDSVLIVDLPCFGSMGKTEAFEKASKLFIPYLHQKITYPFDSFVISFPVCFPPGTEIVPWIGQVGI